MQVAAASDSRALCASGSLNGEFPKFFLDAQDLLACMLMASNKSFSTTYFSWLKSESLHRDNFGFLVAYPRS